MVLCSSRNNKTSSANGHLQVEKATSNGHAIHQTLNVSKEDTYEVKIQLLDIVATILAENPKLPIIKL